MSYTPIATPGIVFSKQLVDAGIVPKNTARIIIDIPCDGVFTLYYQVYSPPEEVQKIGDLLLTMIARGSIQKVELGGKKA